MKKHISWLLAVVVCLSLVVTMTPAAHAAGPTERYLFDAEALPDATIGVLFIYGGNGSSGIVNGGSLYYGIYNPADNSWTQQPVGVAVGAKDAAMALDGSGVPHVVYVSADDKLAYTYLDGFDWTEEVVIESLNIGGTGALSSPDIGVSSDGKPHIAYVDSHGGRLESYGGNHSDLMHVAINGTEQQVAPVVIGDNYNEGGSNWTSIYLVSSPKISVPATQPYFGTGIAARYSGGSNDFSGKYSLFFGSGTPYSEVNFGLYNGSRSSAEAGFQLYGMGSGGAQIYSLYYVNRTIEDVVPAAGLYIAAGTGTPALFSGHGTTVTAGDITVVDTGDVYAAGISDANLTLFQNAEPTTKTLATPILPSHNNRMATVVAGGNQYILYTGNDDDESLFIVSVPTSGGYLTEYQVPNKTPVTITGVTVDDKEYDGTPIAPGGTLAITGAELTEDDLVYAYNGISGTAYPFSTVAPIEAGTYELVISVREDNATYTGASVPINFTIEQKNITVTGTTSVNRDYAPGNMVIALNTDSSTPIGVISADESSVTLDKSSVAGTVATADAGEGKSVTVTGFALSGSKAANYALSQPTGITVNISPAGLSAPAVSLTADSTNGGLSATVSDSVNILGVAGYDVLIYREDVLTKTLTGLSKDAALNIALESGVIEPEITYTAKARAVADASGNYSGSVLGDSSSPATAAYAPLVFTDSDTYNIPASKVGQTITSVNVSGGVAGGKAPYAYSATNLPAWASIDTATGIISGTPTSAAAAGGTATVTVTDAQSNQQSITIAYSSVGKGDALNFGGTTPPIEKTYGDPAFDIAGLTYDGESGAVSYSYMSGPGNLSGTTLTITGAGDIVVKATGTSDNYDTKTIDYTITVNKKAVTITPTASSNTKVYGSAEPGLTYSNTPLVEGSPLSGDILTRVAGENAGDYAISFNSGAAAANPNYDLTLASGSHYFTIMPKVITFTVEAVVGQVYTGSQLSPEPTVKDGTITLTKDTHYTLAYGSNLNAGTSAGSITVTGMANYLGSSASATFNITKATYGGTPIQGTKQVISTTAAENVAYDLSALIFPSGFSNKSFVSVTVENDSQGLLSGPSVSDSMLTFDVAAKAAGISGELHVLVSSDNYNNYTAVITVTTADKTPVAITGVSVTNKTYNATPVVPVGTPTNGGGYSGTYEYRYSGTGSTIYDSPIAPTNAGDYRLTVRIPTTDPTYAGEQTVDFSISKTALTVKPQNISIYIGDALPTPTISYEGLQGSDVGATVAQPSSGNLNMEIKDSDGSTALTNSAIGGGYAIVFIGSPEFSATENYTIATADGFLTITNRPSGGSGGSTLPVAPKQEAQVSGGIGAIAVEVKTDTQTSSASAELTAAQISGGKDIVVTMPQINNVTNNILGMPVSSLSRVHGSGSITLNTAVGNITLPAHMLAGTDSTTGSNAQVSIGTVKTSDLPLAAQEKIGNHSIVSLYLSIDGKATEWNNPDAPVIVSIPYTPTAAELQNPDRITVYYIDGSGNLLEMKDAKYNPVTKMVTFTTTHFSYYAVGYKDLLTNIQFSDVLLGAWYYDAVTFIAERGITSGTGNGKFSPEVSLTRGQFIVMLMRAYGIEPTTNPTDNFSDAGSTYYTGYLAASKQLGISAGVGNNMYAPGKKITRQEMFTLLYNALKVIDQLPEGDSEKALSDFSDATQISSWAKESMTLLVKAGTVGGNGGKLAPTGTTTRAEMAQVLYNLLGK